MLGCTDPRVAPDPRIAKITRWMRSSLNPPLSQLSHELGLSNRQTGRVVTAIFGVNPKILAMRWRAHQAAAQLIADRSLSIAPACDAFYDQSHLIRDLRRFIGTTPRQLARGETFAFQMFTAAQAAGADLL
jgi:AraC-like DNA-binding protein